MNEPRWLGVTLVLAIHADQIREHGGRPGVRDAGLLESALARPRNRFYHDPASDLAVLGAAYAWGVVRNHPFIDGNKRVAFLAMYVFLGVNGMVLDAAEGEVVAMMMAAAAGDVTEPELANWIRERAR